MKLSMIVVAALATTLQALPFVCHAGCGDDQVSVTEDAATGQEQVAMVLPSASDVTNQAEDGSSAN
jgi:hypothetical protein